MTLKDLKGASVARQRAEETVPPVELMAPSPERSSLPTPAEISPVADGRTKLLGARVALAVHREWQGHLYRAQEQQPNLTTQSAMPALIRLLRDEAVWQKFMAELDGG